MRIKTVTLAIFTSLLFALTLNNNNMAQEVKIVDTSLMERLVGKWIIQYDSGTMIEVWDKVSNEQYTGKSQMIVDGKVVFEEIMDLTKEADGKFYFNALIKDKKIKLEVIKAEGDELLYESDSDKNRVSYMFVGEKLHARIIKKEDNSVKEEFLFEKSK